MRRVTTAPGAVDIGGGRMGYRDEDLATGIEGTEVNSNEFLNPVQEAVVRTIEASGLIPTDDLGQFTSALRRMFGGNGLLGERGYMPLPDQTLLQWGRAASVDGGRTAVLFPTKFPSAVRSIVITEQNASGWGNDPQPTVYGSDGGDLFGFIAYAVRITRTGVPIYQGGLSFNWMAIGS